MKHVKFLLINIVAFSFLFFMISLLFPGKVVTSKTVSVSSSKEKLLQKINNTADWKQWNAFANGNAVTNNTIGNSDSLTFIFRNNNNEPLNTRFIIYPESANSILLNWDITEKLPWYKPWKKFSAMVLSKQFAVAMDSSLHNLKVQVEQ